MHFKPYLAGELAKKKVVVEEDAEFCLPSTNKELSAAEGAT